MMRDFTLNTYKALLQSFTDTSYTFQSFSEFLDKPLPRSVMLRHDVDALPENSLKTAQIEHTLGIRGSYYFRIVPQSNHPDIINAIASLGHEIGYHYEDLALSKGDAVAAIKSFENNLLNFRQFGPVKTICMHGSPLSKFDNRKLWESNHYRDYGITGEPYFDLDFTRILYLTDTGRRWDGEQFSIRDKITNLHPHTTTQLYNFHSTFDIIKAAKEGNLSDQIMITVHPQRWTNNALLWTRELVLQNIKNVVKKLMVR
jgi:hypothetical protein